MSLRKIYYSFPAGARMLLRKMYYMPSDVVRSLGKRENGVPIPPRGSIYTGGGDFIETGKKFLDFFIDYTGLAPHHHVLDIGSGMGRMAIPLTTYLDKEAKYEGFDIIEQGVKWCTTNITSRFPNFNFRHIPLSNDLYTDDGESASQLHFPYVEEQFDLVILISVFTHMLPEQTEHYLDEIQKVLKTGGKCFFTVFSYDDVSEFQNKAFHFPHRYENYTLMDDKVKSANVAYKRSFFNDIFVKSGFKVNHNFPGYWRTGKRNDEKDFQDIFVVEKLS